MKPPTDTIRTTSPGKYPPGVRTTTALSPEENQLEQPQHALEKLRTAKEIRRILFSESARPSQQAFDRLRRELGLPCVHLGRRILFRASDVQSFLNRPQPE